MIDLAALRKSAQLTTPPEKLRELYDQAYALVQTRNAEEQQAMLLILERIVLADLGHICRLEFGRNAMTGKGCSVCGVPLAREGQAVALSSRWERSATVLCLCDSCAKKPYEVDIDLLSGALRSPIGHI